MLVRGLRRWRKVRHRRCQRWAQRRPRLWRTAVTSLTHSTWGLGGQGCVVPQFPSPCCTPRSLLSPSSPHVLSHRVTKDLIAPFCLTVSPSRAHNHLRWEETIHVLIPDDLWTTWNVFSLSFAQDSLHAEPEWHIHTKLCLCAAVFQTRRFKIFLKLKPVSHMNPNNVRKSCQYIPSSGSFSHVRTLDAFSPLIFCWVLSRMLSECPCKVLADPRQNSPNYLNWR